MLTHCVLSIICTLMPADNRANDAVKARLIGTWRMVATEEDGKVTKIEEPGYKVVITDSTISILVKNEAILVYTYRIDASKTPVRMYYEVTRAPCLSGAHGEVEENISFDGKKMTIGSAIMEKMPQ